MSKSYLIVSSIFFFGLFSFRDMEAQFGPLYYYNESNNDKNNPRSATNGAAIEEESPTTFFAAQNVDCINDDSFHKNAPQDILDRYVQQHSHQTLEKELQLCRENGIVSAQECLAHRNFGVAYYSCPHQAGNRIHHFLNGIAWSILTNRTVLWKYYDAETCRDVGKGHDPKICENANTKADCDEILALADWIPSLDEWTERLGLPEKKLVPYWSTHIPPKGEDTRKNFAKERHPWHDGDEKYAGVDKNETRVVRFGQMHSRDLRSMKHAKHREYLLHTEYARRAAEGLMSKGGAFLYGFLFHSVFTFTDAVRPDPSYIQDANTMFTVALHSRHPRGNDDGSNVDVETECLAEVLEDVNGEPCAVYLMSDRAATLEKLTKVVESNHGCKVIIPPHTASKGHSSEHGPFAGMGFYQDLALASQARHAFVGHGRSSSLLLEELMAAGQVKDATEGTPDIKKCELKSTHRA